jgi:hypothetical protein
MILLIYVSLRKIIGSKPSIWMAEAHINEQIQIEKMKERFEDIRNSVLSAFRLGSN